MPKKAPPKPKQIYIIAGPNGAGKTTFATQYLPKEGYCADFINADLIAQGIAPFSPEQAAMQAGRIMLEQIAHKVSQGESFSFETTLSGKHYARHIVNWKKAGYTVHLFFLRLPSADLSVARVKGRVAQGGHHVPEETIRRRFDAGLKNFEALYRPLVNRWILYDNSTAHPIPLTAGLNP